MAGVALSVTSRGLASNSADAAAALTATNIAPVVNVRDAQWGAVGDNVADDTTAIQAAINSVRSRGAGVVFFPATSTGYAITHALITDNHVRLVGEQAYRPGASSKLVAHAGTYSNVDPINGGVSELYMLKTPMPYSGGNPPAWWWHGGSVENLSLDCNLQPGLGGFHCWRAGENSLIDRMSVNNTGVVARTVTDGVLNSTTAVSSATGAFTWRDVGSLVTGTGIPANARIAKVTDGTHIVLTLAASATATGVSVTINQPADGVMFEGGAATGLVRSLNGILNSGSLLHLRNQRSGIWHVESLSGDDNGCGNLRVSAGATQGDPMHVIVTTLKAERNFDPPSMDPVVLMDGCGMVNLDIQGLSALSIGTPDTVVKVQQNAVFTAGAPAITLRGAEGANPFNTAYTNIFRDDTTGYVLPAGSYLDNSQYPEFHWNRRLILAGGSEVDVVGAGKISAPNLAPRWSAIVPVNTTNPTVALSGGLTWSQAASANVPSGGYGFNIAGAQNDAAGWVVNLEPGTWKLDTWFARGPDRAIVTIDVSFDQGSSWTTIGTVDGYQAAPGGVATRFSGLVVPTLTGAAWVRMTATDRNVANVATPGYFIAAASCAFTRTV